jgi:hypothetical protein
MLEVVVIVLEDQILARSTDLPDDGSRVAGDDLFHAADDVELSNERDLYELCVLIRARN